MYIHLYTLYLKICNSSENLHQYVPSTAKADPYQLISHGDQLSEERSIDVKLAIWPVMNFNLSLNFDV
jgi:hypothetical protein